MPLLRRSLFIACIFLLLAVPSLAQHQEYHLKLLAVQEGAQGYVGSDADLVLEIQPGTGRVFLETFPLTKLDTQISTRFAKEVACDFFSLDCSAYDFIYTIKAKSNIIGGPSAGAAVAALTAIALLDLEYDPRITITGTINSGGLIGPVGGVKEKLEAAARGRLSEVMIAQGSATQKLADNTTLDLIAYGGNNLSLEVVEAVDLDDVLFHLTQRNLSKNGEPVVEPPEYNMIMAKLQQRLCERTVKIQAERAEAGVLNETLEEEVQQKTAALENFTLAGDHYSAASFCFGNNVALKTNFYQQRRLTLEAYQRLFSLVEQKIGQMESALAKERIETISDLQTFMIVEERLQDASQQVIAFRNATTDEVSGDPSDDPAGLLAYAEERYYAAVSWSEFFRMEGKHLVFNHAALESSCLKKIAEGQERHQYASLFFGEEPLGHIVEKLSRAEKMLEEDRPTLCLMLAAQAKADANAILSTLGLPEENLAMYLESKRRAVERVIAHNSKEGVFPILGYSYYQYGSSLQESQPYNSLVYFEYALEMSDLGMYFPEEQGAKPWFNAVTMLTGKQKAWLLVAEGFVVGVIAGGLLMFILGGRKKKKFKK